MGIGNSRKLPNFDELDKPKGYFPSKLSPKKSKYKQRDYQMLLVNNELYKMNLENLELEKINVDGNVKFYDECNLLMESNCRQFYVSGGNFERDSFFSDCYLFDCVYPSKPLKVDSLPFPMSGHRKLIYHERKLYLIGGMSLDSDTSELMMNDRVFVKDIKDKNGTWELLGVNKTPRFNFHVVLNNESILIFGGESLNKDQDLTHIEVFDLTYNVFTTINAFKFHFDLVNSEICPHGDDLLIIGGEAQGAKVSNVWRFGLKDKDIMSLRRMEVGGSAGTMIAFQSDYDVITAIGLSEGELICQKRKWDYSLLDYIWRKEEKFKAEGYFKNAIQQDKFQIRVIKPVNSCHVSIKSKLPRFNTDSNYLFGSDYNPFIFEITDNLKVKVHPAPLELPLCTSQVCFRYSNSKIYFFGGMKYQSLETTSKNYLLDLDDRCVIEMNDMVVPRMDFGYTRLGFFLFVTGGVSTSQEGDRNVLSSAERFSFKTEEWEELEQIVIPRSGHLMWNDMKTKKIYIAGGYGMNGELLSSVEVYDQESKKWELCEQRMASPLADTRITSMNQNKFYYTIGGVSASSEGKEEISSILKFHKEYPSQMKQVVSLAAPRHNCQVFLDWKGNNIFIFGGTEEPIFEIYRTKDLSRVNNSFTSHLTNEFYALLCNHTIDIDLNQYSSG